MRRPLWLALIVMATTAAVPAAQQAPLLDHVLTTMFGFSSGELRAVAQGRAVAHSLSTSMTDEIAAAGAVRIDVPLSALIEWSHQVEGFRRGSGVRQVQLFSEPPIPEDLAAMTMPAEDISDLAECVVGACALKLRAEDIERFRRDVRWGGPNETDEATRVMRGVLLDTVLAYRRDGLPGIGQPADKAASLDIPAEFAAIAHNDPMLGKFAPDVLRYVTSYPASRQSGVRDVFYWSKINFGLKDTLRVDHLSSHPVEDGVLGLRHVFATTQIHASHYFRTTLDVRFVFQTPGQSGFTIVNVSRSRSDGLTGVFGWIVRAKVRRGARSGLEGYLARMKATLESVREKRSELAVVERSR